MTNLIGDEINDYEQWLTVPGATLHLYGKGPPRPPEDGHVTQVRRCAKNHLIGSNSSRFDCAWALRQVDIPLRSDTSARLS